MVFLGLDNMNLYSYKSDFTYLLLRNKISNLILSNYNHLIICSAHVKVLKLISLGTLASNN